ncbi:hypothetical protein GCM10009733_081290 [Nonomuraea maheshkhaliensis]|uniref:Uncharacterized protein n=1 Tax=Nonomuraea maheshkhaliensis TaxID=419590 RepID=A0ABN2GIF4_9ACTN
MVVDRDTPAANTTTSIRILELTKARAIIPSPTTSMKSILICGQDFRECACPKNAARSPAIRREQARRVQRARHLRTGEARNAGTVVPNVRDHPNYRAEITSVKSIRTD